MDVDFALVDDVDAAQVGVDADELVGLEDALYEFEGDDVLDAAAEVGEEEEAAFYDFYVGLLHDFWVRKLGVRLRRSGFSLSMILVSSFNEK